MSTYYSICVGDLLQASGTPRNPISSLSRLRASIIFSFIISSRFFLFLLYEYLPSLTSDVTLFSFNFARMLQNNTLRICSSSYTLFIRFVRFVRFGSRQKLGPGDTPLPFYPLRERRVRYWRREREVRFALECIITSSCRETLRFSFPFFQWTSIFWDTTRDQVFSSSSFFCLISFSLSSAFNKSPKSSHNNFKKVLEKSLDTEKSYRKIQIWIEDRSEFDSLRTRKTEVKWNTCVMFPTGQELSLLLK